MRALLFTTTIALAACGPQPEPQVLPPSGASSTPKITGPFEADTALRWLADGRLLVGRAQELHPKDPTIRPTDVQRPPGEVAFNAEAVGLSVQGATLTLGAKAVTIPVWISGAERADVLNTAFWLDGGRVYVHQAQRNADGVECRLYDRAAETWTLPTADCVEGDFHLVSGFIRGPGPLVGIVSAGEGRTSVSLTQFDPRRGQSAFDKVPTLKGVPASKITFGAGGGTAWVVSPCLISAGACAKQGPSRLYAIDLFDGTTTDEGEVPDGAVPGPDGRLAWIGHGAVCVGRPGKARCHTP